MRCTGSVGESIAKSGFHANTHGVQIRSLPENNSTQHVGRRILWERGMRVPLNTHFKINY